MGRWRLGWWCTARPASAGGRGHETGVDAAVFRLLHVSRKGGERFKAQLAPDAFEHVFGRVGSFAEPVTLPGRLSSTGSAAHTARNGGATRRR